MGAEFITAVVKGCSTVEQLKSRFSRMVEDAAHDSGHGGYTGTWAEVPGIEVNNSKVFNSHDDAEEFLDQNTKKWENAIAVKVAIAGKTESKRDAKRLAKLKASWDKAQALADVAERAIKNVKKTAKGYYKCRHCGSLTHGATVNRHFKNTHECVVCKNYLAKETDCLRFKKLSAKADIAKTEYYKVSIELSTFDWMIGAVASC